MTPAYRPPGVAERGTAIVLLSGGLDSATVLALAHAEGWDCRALTLRYGQRHSHEIEAAKRLARAMELVEHRLINLDLAGWGGSSLTGDGEVPHGGPSLAGAAGTATAPAPTSGSSPATPPVPETTPGGGPGAARRPGAAAIPSTYVPARNTILLSLALSWAEAIGAQAIFLGVSAVDYSGYPDCRPEFVAAFQQLADIATRAGLAGEGPVVRAPLINKSKAETIRWGAALGVDYGLTWSCYDPAPEGRPCGDCDSCRLRAKGFAEAGLEDPLLAAG